MSKLLSSTVILLILAVGAHAQTVAPDAPELTRILNEFLAGASQNNVAVHDNFWAEELIYTGSGGRRRTKAEVMRDVRAAPAPKPGDAKTTFTAEEIRVQQFGDTAVVSFRLVGTIEKDGRTEIARLMNSGTFLKRNGKWQVVYWQSTRMPRVTEEAKKDVADIEDAFYRSLIATEVKNLGTLLDDTFIWLRGRGEQMTRQQFLDRVGSGRLKHAKTDTSNVTINVYGDTAVVRHSTRQFVASSRPGRAGRPGPWTLFYTLIFMNKEGTWKAVALHTSWV